MTKRTLKTVVAERPLITINQNCSVFDAAVLMTENHVGSLIVENEGNLVGIFTERDLLSRVVSAGLDYKKTQVAVVMSTNVIGLDSSKSLCHALHLMHRHSFRHVPVFEDGSVIGIISARDALGNEMHEFECENKRAEDLFEILA